MISEEIAIQLVTELKRLNDLRRVELELSIRNSPDFPGWVNDERVMLRLLDKLKCI